MHNPSSNRNAGQVKKRFCGLGVHAAALEQSSKGIHQLHQQGVKEIVFVKKQKAALQLSTVWGEKSYTAEAALQDKEYWPQAFSFIAVT